MAHMHMLQTGRPHMHMAMRSRVGVRVTPNAPLCVGIKPLPVRRRVEVREVGVSREGAASFIQLACMLPLFCDAHAEDCHCDRTAHQHSA